MLYQRGQIWWVKFKAGGQTFQRSARTTKKSEARQEERRLRSEVARELHTGRTGIPTEHTYGEALIRWAKEGAPKSMFSHMRNTRPHLENVPLHLVVPAAHQMKSAMLKEELSPMTINRRLAVVRRVLNVAYKEWEWIDRPLGQRIQLLSEKGMAREFFLSREEVETLVGALENPESKRVLMLLAYTGLRKSELLRLTPGNWQPPYFVLTSNTKSKKPRAVPLIEDLHGLVSLPFQITDWELRKDFEQARDAIQRPEIRIHDLRHTFASWLAKNPNVPITAIRDILGHSNLAVTNKYAHLRGDTMDIVTQALKKK